MSEMRSGFLDDALRPFDVARREALLWVRWFPWIGNAARRKEARIAVLASAGVVLAFALTSVVPGVLFVLGPALLGVLHVASDVRYLILRQNLPRRWLTIVATASLALIGFRVAELAFPGTMPFARIEVGIGWTWGIVGAWLGASMSVHAQRWQRAAFATVSLGAATAMAVSYPGQARALFALGHNVVALAIWLLLFRRRRARAAIPLALVAAGTWVLAAGGTLSFLRIDGPWVTRLIEEATSIAPSFAPGTLLVTALSYVFLQAVHYSVWLTWIPQEEVRNDATLTFRMSARSARRDFGMVGVAFIVVAALAVAACSLASVHRTRAIYLSVATFHGYLEVACLAFLWVSTGSSLRTCSVSATGRPH